MFRKPLIALILTFACLPVMAGRLEQNTPWSPVVDSHLRNEYHNPAPALLLAKKWDELSPEEKKRVKEARDRYRKLPNDKKKRLRDRWEKMPKKERDKYKLEKEYR